MSKDNETLMHITLTKTLKEKLQEIKKNSSFSTISDFVREAIREKIRKMENPSLNQNGSNIPSEYLQQIMHKLDNQEKMIKLLQERDKTKSQISETSTSLHDLIKNGIVNKVNQYETDILYNTLKKYGALSLGEIKDKTKHAFDKMLIQYLDSNQNSLFKLTSGKWRAIENE